MAPPRRCESEALERTWMELTAGETRPPATPSLDLTGEWRHLRSRLPVEEAAVAAVGAALQAASAFAQQRGAAPSGVTLDREHVEAAVRSERHFRVDGQPAGASFAPLSRFWKTADGWIRTHANYPWHRRALLAALGLPSTLADNDADAAVEEVAGAAAAERAAEIEDRVFAAGGVAGAFRTAAGWQGHAQGRAVAEEPLISYDVAGEAPSRRRHPALLPMAGVRVLDLTRVIAGPVCTRFLGALGADVLRLDPPDRPDVAPGAAADTLLGKRSAFLNLAAADGRDVLHQLLDGADVVVHGYRPGALERFGLGVADLAARHPGLVVVQLDAWGHSGPWARRRGFDSIVQAACGIAASESSDGTTPGVLPCQLLDHGTGYLAAAAALDGLRRQSLAGGTVVRSLSLARTAAWLASLQTDASQTDVAETNRVESSTDGASADPADQPWLVELSRPAGSISAVAPPGGLDGRPLEWPQVGPGYGADTPGWAPG
jgi:crotonobetainyl-CoA:carnitine CoA-transferase CaiB-like acyl-CoA transferase